MAHAKLEKAMAMLLSTSPEAVLQTVEHIRDDHPPHVGEHQRLYVEAMQIGVRFSRSKDTVLEFLDGLDHALGAEPARGARAGVLKGYLSGCESFGKNWDADTLQLLCNTHHPSSPASLWKDVHDLTDRPETLAGKDVDSWMSLARTAVCIACPPVLKALAPLIRRQSVNGMCEALRLGECMQEGRMGDNYIPDQFKAAMSVLVAQGLNMNTTGANEPPLVFHVATSGVHALSKLAILLELGMDPHARKSPDDHQPASDCIKDPRTKDQWESIVRSFEARKSLMDMLFDFDRPSP